MSAQDTGVDGARKGAPPPSRGYVVVHGHFYQPPRENPWLEAIERQPSAWPAHDWNERVTDECYAPNVHARTLDAEGAVIDIANNYAKLSFNFGPTLLGWMERANPSAYAAILEADTLAKARGAVGGAALAQVYNHMIMPLASPRDQRTQVRWGMRDFEHRFGRKARGMWLAETAVDVASLEALSAEGVEFTVLAPHQCAAVRPAEGAWTPTPNANVETRRPYRVPLPSGRSITVFFYDGPTSRAVAFERLLDDGHRLAERLLAPLNRPVSDGTPPISHIATDGETYGHHHAYGEMALAVALARIEREPGVELVSYEQLLDRQPATWEARIQDETSWSCAHGVERWRSDCGCNSGTGWHQRWRAPLRDALDWLRDELGRRYEATAGELLTDPWAARDEYIDFVLGRESAAELLARHQRRPLSADERCRARALLEMQRQAQLMYTSCGWFFDELSNIETVQVLQYAARAIDLAHGLLSIDLETPFLDRLERAPSNRPEYGDGRGVYAALVEPAKTDLSRVGAHFAVAKALGAGAETLRAFACEHIEHDLARSGGSRLATGRLRVRSRITGEAADLGYAVVRFGDHDLLGGVRPFAPVSHVALHGALTQAFSRADLTEVVRQMEQQLPGATFSLRSLTHDAQASILEGLLEERTRAARDTYATLYDRHAPLMRYLQSLGQPPPAVFRTAAEHTLMARLDAALSEGAELDVDRVHGLLAEARDANVPLDGAVLGRALLASLVALVAAADAEPDDVRRLVSLERAASFVASAPWKIDLLEAQNAAWQLGRRLLGRYRESGDEERLARLQHTAAQLGLRLE